MPKQEEEKPSRLRSVVIYPFAWGVENLADTLPEWNAYGLMPEVYTALSGGIREAANYTRHKHGLNLGRLPTNIGFQNAYSILNFSGGTTKTDEIFTFRRSSTGVETPIDFKSPGRSPSVAQLQAEGESSKDKELEIGSAVVRSLLSDHNQRGDFIRAGCYGEITDMDATRIPDPTKYAPLYTGHEIFLTGQIGQRTLVANTPNGAVYRYKSPSPWEKIKTYTRTDFRYTIRNAPIEILGLEKLEVFKGPALQRLLSSLAAGTVRSEQDDYIPSYNVNGLPVRADGVINPFARFPEVYQH